LTAKRSVFPDLTVGSIYVCTTAGATGHWRIKLPNSDNKIKIQGNISEDHNTILGFCGEGEDLTSSFELKRGEEVPA